MEEPGLSTKFDPIIIMDSVCEYNLYFVVAAIIVVFSIMTVTSRRISRSATYLLFVLIGTALFYFQLGYQFLRRRADRGLRRRYHGAVRLLYSALPADPMKRQPGSSRTVVAQAPFMALAGTVLLLLAIFYMPLVGGESLAGSIEAGQMITMQDIGHAMLGTDRFQYLLP